MFRRVIILAALVLGCGVSVSAQGYRIGDAQPVSSSLTSTSPITPLQATVAVCVNPANAVPCTNKASTFTSVTLVTGCATSTQVVLAGTTTCVTQTDSRGNWGAWVAAGNYDITFTLTTGQSFGPYTISVGIPSGTVISPTLTTLNGSPFVGGTAPQIGASSDIHAQLNAAYAAASANGQKAYLLPPVGGGCYQSSVPLVLNTPGKYFPIEGVLLGNQFGAVKQGTCINFTPTGTIATTAASVTSNIITLTLASNPIAFGVIVGEALNLAGFTGADTYLNQTFPVLTVTSTQITLTFIGGHANATATTNGTISHSAVTLDYTVTQGGGITPLTALKSIIWENNGCVNTVGGCGSASNGIVFGPNAGVFGAKLENVTVYGFLNGYFVPNAQAGNIGWSLTFDNSWAGSNGTGFALSNLATSETTRWRGGGFALNGTGFSCGTSITTDVSFDDAVSFDVNNLGISNAGCRITLNPHNENSNFSGAGLPYITQSAGVITMTGGRFMQDSSVGGPDSSFITETGGSINLYGTEVFSGRTVTNLINNTGGGLAYAVWYTESPTLVAPDVAGVPQTCSTAYRCYAVKLLGAGGATTQKVVIPTLQFPFDGGGSPDGTASTGTVFYNASLNRTQLEDNGALHDDVNGTRNILTASSTDTISNKSTAAGPVTGTVASGTAIMTTAAIASQACGTVVTVAATNVLTTDRITANDNAQPAAATNGVLIIKSWPTANNVNFFYCNPTAGSVTPAAATLNWSVVR